MGHLARIQTLPYLADIVRGIHFIPCYKMIFVKFDYQNILSEERVDLLEFADRKQKNRIKFSMCIRESMHM